jgi:4-hydroxybenzoyl-CoA thioesterase
MKYQKSIRVEFNHCDPAGIVFYPRYFEMFNSVIENFFAEAVGVSFADMHVEPGCGTPVVDAQARFSNPTRLNEVLLYTLVIENISRSTLTVLITAENKGEKKLEARIVSVWMKNWKSQRWPEAMREKMLPYLEPQT